MYHWKQDRQTDRWAHHPAKLAKRAAASFLSLCHIRLLPCQRLPRVQDLVSPEEEQWDQDTPGSPGGDPESCVPLGAAVPLLRAYQPSVPSGPLPMRGGVGCKGPFSAKILLHLLWISDAIFILKICISVHGKCPGRHFHLPYFSEGRTG